MNKTNLRGVVLNEANLNGADLSGADLSWASLNGAELRQASLIEASLNNTTITDACLWEIRSAGWSIQGIICETIYWDRNREERMTYTPGQFEQLHADQQQAIY